MLGVLGDKTGIVEGPRATSSALDGDEGSALYARDSCLSCYS